MSKTGPGYLYVSGLNTAFFYNATRKAFGRNALPCGVCYELAGPHKTIRVMVTDITDDVGEGLVHFDMSKQAYMALIAPDTGAGLWPVTYRMVSCDVDGPLKIFVGSGANAWYAPLFVINSRVMVTKMELSQKGGTTPWVSIDRSDYNQWVASPVAGTWEKSVPVHVRVTSITGEQIVVVLDKVIGSLLVEGTQQFSAVPEGFGGGSSKCCSQPNHYDVVFNDDWHEPWRFFTQTGGTHAIDSSTHAEGTSSVKLTFNAWNGISVGTMVPVPSNQFNTFNFWAKVDSPSTFHALRVTFSGRNKSGSKTYDFTGMTSEWARYSVSLSTLAMPADIAGMFIQSDRTATVWLDEGSSRGIEFEGSSAVGGAAAGVVALSMLAAAL
eukprot:m51a1_g9965 hypothetical protein (382) ;mRNA; r:82822-84479